MQDIKKVLGDVPEFLQRLSAYLVLKDLPLRNLILDHICYRVETWERYMLKKAELALWGELLTESEVNGRPIALYLLQHPIPLTGFLQGQSLKLIELPSPKPGRHYPEGLEHAEFVYQGKLQSLVDRYPQLSWEQGMLKNTVNPEVHLSERGWTIKIHERFLEEIVALEKSSGPQTP